MMGWNLEFLTLIRYFINFVGNSLHNTFVINNSLKNKKETQYRTFNKIIKNPLN